MGTERASFDYVSPDSLRFDPSNPRFGGQLSRKTDNQIEEILLGKPYYADELIDSFLQNGFIDYEPLVVRREDGHFIVLEGNRRLAAVRHILRNRERYESAENKEKIDSLTRVPVLKFPPGDAVEAAERIYLGLRHLLGYREWPPLSKAKFLNREINAVGDVDRVVRELGITKSDIQRYLVPFRALQKAKLEVPAGSDWWLLGEALSRSGIKKYVELDVDRKTIQINYVHAKKLAHLLDFLYGRVDKQKKSRDPSTASISDTRQLSLLAKSLNSDKASAALEDGSELQLALMFVESKEESVGRLMHLLDDMSALLKDAFKLSSRKADEKAVLAAFKQLETTVKQYLTNAKSHL